MERVTFCIATVILLFIVYFGHVLCFQFLKNAKMVIGRLGTFVKLVCWH